MFIEIQPAQYQDVPVDAHGNLCAPEEADLAISTAVGVWRDNPRGTVQVQGDARVLARCEQSEFTEVTLTAVRLLSKLGARAYPVETGLWLFPGLGKRGVMENRLQVRKSIVDSDDGAEERYAVFVFDFDFVARESEDYTQSLPGPWVDSEVVFEVQLGVLGTDEAKEAHEGQD